MPTQARSRSVLSLLAALAVLGTSALAGAPTVALAQPRCDAPRAMVVVDRSSSMSASRGGLLSSGDSKWGAARRAFGELAAAYADTVDIGLAIYPATDGANSCDPGAVVLDAAPHPADELMAVFPAADPPHSGNWTATSQTLDTLVDHATLADMTRDRHVILITDGEQCCYGSGSGCLTAQRFWPVESIMRLRALGAYVHVVGFGERVDALTLNRAAVAGGTALPGCEMESDDPASPDNCYLQANDLADLRAALDAVARLITDESCDGYDNDCDGGVDEGFDVDVDRFTTCGSDIDVPGTPLDRTLVDCDDAEPLVHPGAPEICNHRDDDCDGVMDPGCECTNGGVRPCGSEVGACEPGIQVCEEGAWSECRDAIAPTSEVCDGVDSDCNGTVDDGATCADMEACVEGACVPLAVPPPPVMEGGCCSVAAGAGRDTPRGGLALVALVGILFVLRQRRQRG